MTDWRGKRYWLVGASEGLGAALAHKLSSAGVEVILSARSEERLLALAESLPGKAQVLPMDVADTASVRAAAQEAGEIDGMVFLAGVYWPMPATSWQADEAVAMGDVNFTGLVRVLGQVVPQMTERDNGHIVITGSLAGFRGLRNSIGYGASKAGTMVMAESLYADLWRTGVRVQLANPGFIRTRLTDKNDFKMPALMEPDAAAQKMFEHMNSTRFRMSFPSPFAWVFRIAQLLPDAIYYRLFA